MDLQMPEMDGFTATEEIRKNFDAPKNFVKGGRVKHAILPPEQTEPASECT